VLPTAFLQPADGTNALYVSQRSTRARTGQPIADSTIISGLSTQFIKNLKIPSFSAQSGVPSFGGGEYNTPQFQHDEIGALESIPHGPVHNLVGSDYDPATKGPILPYGFMTDLLTAARDPIFWLHHSNIDRLWQMWLDLDPAHKNPTNNAWLKTAFTFAAPGGGTKSWNVSDVLDTTELGYQYDTVAPPRVLVAVGWGRRRTAASGIPLSERRTTPAVRNVLWHHETRMCCWAAVDDELPGRSRGARGFRHRALRDGAENDAGHP
jgi:tyrosinase